MSIIGLDFIVKLKGRGVVNFDGDVAKKYVSNDINKNNNNRKYAKTAIKSKFNEEGNFCGYEKLVKISANCLRHNIFKPYQPFQTSHVLASLTETLPYLVATKSFLLRGSLWPGKQIYKRKSPFTISDAIQKVDKNKSKEILKFEVGCSSGTNDSTSFFEEEQCGDISYRALGSINFSELAFISCDPIFSRQGFNSDDYPEIKRLFKERHDIELPEINYYKKVNSEVPVSERGVLLDKKIVFNLVCELLELILKTYISVRTGFASVTEIKIIATKTNERFLDFGQKDSITIKDHKKIEEELTAFFNADDICLLYKESDKQSIEVRDTIEATVTENKKQKKEKKKKEKEEKEKNKKEKEEEN